MSPSSPGQPALPPKPFTSAQHIRAHNVLRGIHVAVLMNDSDDDIVKDAAARLRGRPPYAS